MTTPWEKLDEVLAAYDADFKVDIGTASCWSGQLRVTLTNPEGKPSRSVTFFSAGQAWPEDVATEVLADLERCLDEWGIEPMAPPDWMFE